MLCRPQAEEPESDLEPDSPPARRHFPITSFTNHLSVFGGLRRTSWRRCSRPQTLGQQSCLVQVPQEGVPDARPSPCASALATSGNVVVICHHQVLSVFACSNAPQHVSGGTTVRIEGCNLAGDDVKVFVGGILCDHVAVRSPQGGSSITCVTPPCQGDLKVDVIVEVDGRRATGCTTFQYHTPAPRVQQTDVVLLRNHTGHLQVPVNGEGVK